MFLWMFPPNQLHPNCVDWIKSHSSICICCICVTSESNIDKSEFTAITVQQKVQRIMTLCDLKQLDANHRNKMQHRIKYNLAKKIKFSFTSLLVAVVNRGTWVTNPCPKNRCLICACPFLYYNFVALSFLWSLWTIIPLFERLGPD